MSCRRLQVLRVQSGQSPVRRPDLLAVEEPLEIRVDTRPVSVTMRTPGHDAELAAGFLLSEGIVRQHHEIAGIAPHPRKAAGQVLNVFLTAEVSVDWNRLTRHVFASSSCGVCGKSTIESVHTLFPPVKSRDRFPAELFPTLPERLRAKQVQFGETGGVHAAALFDARGKLLVVREDVGRHNAVDKVLGFALLKRKLPLDRHILLVSGRASFEILQKALAARVPIVAAISAPSSLAVEFARSSGQTLIGFLREENMNVYTGAQRIRTPR